MRRETEGSVMRPDAKAMIENGRVLAFNPALAVEVTVLAGGPTLGREKARRFAAGRDAAADFAPYLDAPAPRPDSRGDKLATALRVVRLVGNAAGAEMYRRDYDGEWAALVRAFQSGVMSEREPKESADGTLGDLFSECGKHAARIVSCALPDDFEDGASEETAFTLIGMVTDAFAEGMEEALS
jgi:hypothetical protein